MNSEFGAEAHFMKMPRISPDQAALPTPSHRVLKISRPLFSLPILRRNVSFCYHYYHQPVCYRNQVTRNRAVASHPAFEM